MDNSLYTETTVRCGHKYRYYFSPPADGKPVLLFLHGFPSTSYGWHKQIEHFQPLGYGIVAPDLLGSGGTAKPLDYNEFRMNAMAEDVLDILKAEGIAKVVGVSHDWGAGPLTRLSILHKDVFIGFVWLANAYMEPQAVPFDIDGANAMMKSLVGIEVFAYWTFFTREDAPTIIEKNVDSFLQLVYPNNPDEWLTHMVVSGKTADCIEGNIQLGRPSWLSDEDYQAIRQTIVTNGVRSSLNWYTAQNNNIDLDDIKQITEEQKRLTSPSLVVLTMRDPLCIPQFSHAAIAKFGTQVEYSELQTGHWPQLEAPGEVNAKLQEWLSKLSL